MTPSCHSFLGFDFLLGSGRASCPGVVIALDSGSQCLHEKKEGNEEKEKEEEKRKR